jgi:diacylglycerol kinase (ATP)
MAIRPRSCIGCVVRVWILVNEDAGRSLSNDTLRELTTHAGHSLVGLVTKRHGDIRPPKGGVDLIVAAGGDGTVATAAALSAEASTAFAILPLGTANNIAASLDLSRDVPQLIASWERARRVPFDLAHACTRSKKWLVVEGVGGGLLPAGIIAAKRALDYAEAHPAHEVAAAVRLFAAALKELQPVQTTITIDGMRLTQDLLMFEVLNIRSIGPNLVFAPSASPTDGMFDIILAGPEHRADLLRYFESHSANRHAPVLPHYRGRRVRLGPCEHVHIDDEIVDARGLGEIDLTIEPGATEVLI